MPKHGDPQKALEEDVEGLSVHLPKQLWVIHLEAQSPGRQIMVSEYHLTNIN